MIKSYLIAIALFVVAVFLSIFTVKRKQRVEDVRKAKDVAAAELNRIKDASNHAKQNAANRPDSGPDSNADNLRDNWSER